MSSQSTRCQEQSDRELMPPPPPRTSKRNPPPPPDYPPPGPPSVWDGVSPIYNPELHVPLQNSVPQASAATEEKKPHQSQTSEKSTGQKSSSFVPRSVINKNKTAKKKTAKKVPRLIRIKGQDGDWHPAFTGVNSSLPRLPCVMSKEEIMRLPTEDQL